jgi:hypothetical protein
VRRAALVLVALTLTGCETTAEKSAKLEKEALRHAKPASTKGIEIAKANRFVKVLSATLVMSSEGGAAVVTLRNTSAKAQAHLPLIITASSSSGAKLYTNDAPGQSPSLTSVPLVPAHGETTWVDDQAQGVNGSAKLSAEVGEGSAVHGSPPVVVVLNHRLESEPGGGTTVAGSVANRSQVEQKELVVFAVARRAGKITAAGRAVLESVPAGTTSRFQIFLIGNATGASIEVTAPASSAD